MRVLVLGGTGLISTAIVKRLTASGHETILFNRGQSANRLNTDLQIITGDRADHADFAAKMAAVDVDAVIDMITFDAPTAEHAIQVFKGRVQHYLFCSTVCVYGGPVTKIPTTEDEPHTPTGDYGRNKSLAEAVFMQGYADQGFPVTMFRPSHCYGPGQPLLDISGYNPCLVNRYKEGRAIIVPGDGHGLWQPGHIDDVAKGFVGALGRDVTLGKAYNVVGDEIMTWNNFHRHMAQALGYEAHIIPATTQQILAAGPKDVTWMLDEIFQYHNAFSNAALKADVPEFTDLMQWEDGVRDTAAWMDAADIHQPCDTQPWIDTLAEKLRLFERELAE